VSEKEITCADCGESFPLCATTGTRTGRVCLDCAEAAEKPQQMSKPSFVRSSAKKPMGRSFNHAKRVLA
jgi:recombinational DNA repair protein (RecF pathway)